MTICNNNSFEKPSFKVWCFLFLIIAVYFIRDLSSIPIPEMVFIIVTGVAFAVLPVSDAFCVYVMTIPLTLPSNPIRLIYFVITLFKLYKKRQLRLNQVMVFTVCILCFIMMFDFLKYDSGISSAQCLYSMVEKLLFIVIPCLWFSLDLNIYELKNSALGFVIGVLTSSLSLIIMTVKSRGWEVLFSAAAFERLGMGVSNYYLSYSSLVTTVNTNDLAVMNVISVAILLVLLDKQLVPKAITFIGICMSLFVVLLTKKRTGLVCSALVFIALYFNITFKRKKLFKGLLLLIFLSILIVIVEHIMPDLFQSVIGRFIGQIDISNGRNALNQQYLEVWISDPWCLFFGYGIEDYTSIANIQNSAHNGFIDILMIFGIVGLVTILVFMISLFNNRLRTGNGPINWFSILPAFIAFVATMVGQYFTTPATHIRLCFLVVFTCMISRMTKERALIQHEVK